MYKNFLLIIIFLFFTQCSLDTKSGFWTKSEVIDEKEDKLEEIFKSKEVLEKEFNADLKIRIKSVYTQNRYNISYKLIIV